jgi:hypothetical protein
VLGHCDAVCRFRARGEQRDTHSSRSGDVAVAITVRWRFRDRRNIDSHPTQTSVHGDRDRHCNRHPFADVEEFRDPHSDANSHADSDAVRSAYIRAAAAATDSGGPDHDAHARAAHGNTGSADGDAGAADGDACASDRDAYPFNALSHHRK